MLRDKVHRVDRVYLSIPEAPAHAASHATVLCVDDGFGRGDARDQAGTQWLGAGGARIGAANGEALQAGDGAAVSAAGALKLEGDDDAELLLFDMAL